MSKQYMIPKHYRSYLKVESFYFGLRDQFLFVLRDCSEFLVGGIVLFGKSARKKCIPPIGVSVKFWYPPRSLCQKWESPLWPQGVGRCSGQQGRIA